jgi:hypothetical protein
MSTLYGSLPDRELWPRNQALFGFHGALRANSSSRDRRWWFTLKTNIRCFADILGAVPSRELAVTEICTDQLLFDAAVPLQRSFTRRSRILRANPLKLGGDIGCGMLAVGFDAEATALHDPGIAGRVLAGLGRAVPARRRNRRAAIAPPPDLELATLTAWCVGVLLGRSSDLRSCTTRSFRCVSVTRTSGSYSTSGVCSCSGTRSTANGARIDGGVQLDVSSQKSNGNDSAHIQKSSQSRSLHPDGVCRSPLGRSCRIA